MPRGVKSADAAALSPEEIAAKRQERKDAQERRDRVKLLGGAEAALTRCRRALQEGDLEGHTHWLETALAQLDAYARTVAYAERRAAANGAQSPE